jgi:hypothetical protein
LERRPQRALTVPTHLQQTADEVIE